jgi:hypothetical protein
MKIRDLVYILPIVAVTSLPNDLNAADPNANTIANQAALRLQVANERVIDAVSTSLDTMIFKAKGANESQFASELEKVRHLIQSSTDYRLCADFQNSGKTGFGIPTNTVSAQIYQGTSGGNLVTLAIVYDNKPLAVFVNSQKPLTTQLPWEDKKPQTLFDGIGPDYAVSMNGVVVSITDTDACGPKFHITHQPKEGALNGLFGKKEVNPQLVELQTAARNSYETLLRRGNKSIANGYEPLLK